MHPRSDGIYKTITVGRVKAYVSCSAIYLNANGQPPGVA